MASLVLVSMASGALALAVYLRDPRNKANRAFALTVVTSVLWVGLAFLSDQPQFRPQALVLNRLTFATALVMGVSLVKFVLEFPGRHRVSPWWNAFLGFGLLTAVLTATTPFVVARVAAWSNTGTDVESGPAFAAYAAWVLCGIGVIVWVLGRRYRRVTGRARAQLRYVLLGVSLFAALSMSFGLLIPAFTGSYAIASLNTFTPLILFGFISYAMIKHRLMDMRVVVLRGVLYTSLVALFAAGYMLLAVLTRMKLFAAFGLAENIAFVVAGVIAVFVFQPLREMLENVTDKIFYRRRYDEQTLLERLADGLAGTANPATIAEAVATVLTEQLKSGMAVLVHEVDGQLTVYGEGIPAEDPDLREVISASAGHPVLAEEFEEDSRLGGLLSERGIRLVATFENDDTATSLLLGEKRSGEIYTEHDVRFVQMLLPEIAIALKTAELFEQRDQRVRELTALNHLASVLGEDIQLDALLRHALSEVIRVVSADGGSIMLLDSSTQMLKVGAAQGLSPEVVRDTRVALGDRISGWVAKNRTSLLMVDEDFPTPFERRTDAGRSSVSTPLISHLQVIGVLNLNRSSSAATFTQENLAVVTSFAGQLAVAIENAQLYSDLEGHVIGTITALAAAVEAKDPYTYGHSSQVTSLALAIASEMGLSPHETDVLRRAALLHDIGKIGVDGLILNKPGQLDTNELDAIRRHPEIAANILSSLEFLDEVVPLVLHHHERFDGKGYPSGIAGQRIPLGARIICVADSYDAMTTDRTYRRGLSPVEAVAELRRHAGTQFDPAVVDAYLRVRAVESVQTLTTPESIPEPVMVAPNVGVWRRRGGTYLV